MPAEEPLTLGDAEILRGAAGGDASRFEEFVERHDAAVLRFIRSRCANPSRVEDALQETFLSAWRSAGNFQGAGSARAWLLTIARNAVNRLFRRHAGEPAEFVPLDSLGVPAGWGAESTDDGPSGSRTGTCCSGGSRASRPATARC